MSTNKDKRKYQQQKIAPPTNTSMSRSPDRIELGGLFGAICQLFGTPIIFPKNTTYGPYALVMFFLFVFCLVNYSLFKYIRTRPTPEIVSRRDILDTLKLFITGLSNIVIFAGIYDYFGIVDTSIVVGNPVVTNDYFTSFYFSVVTWTTLGYGDFKPIASLRMVAAAEALMGYVYMAILVGMLIETIRTTRSD